ncbi:hypothetical protein [Lysobacter sp. Hz 25]|uniref:hypothetical protein n=1 Tax=Lysobacter sp. Hz 25 TaxID=3383698 RepID=UPI0038D398C4
MILTQWFSLGLVILLLAVSVFAFWQGSSLVDELLKLKKQKIFSADLVLALLNRGKSLTLQHIQQIAETRGVTQHEIQRTLKILLREVLAQRNLSLQEHQPLIESLIKEMKEREPFDGLPNEIRIHLERLREDMQASPDRLEPLTIQIRELVTLKSREYRVQKYYTIGGFLLGVIGLAFAAYTYWFPPQPIHRAEQPTKQIAVERR